MNKNRRTQTKKPVINGRNEKFNEAMREKGRSSATDRHRSAKDYRRKPKHGGWSE